MKNNKTSFLLYTENIEAIDAMSDEDAGKLIKVIFTYVATGQAVTGMLPAAARPIFALIKSQLDRNKEAYEAECEKRKQAAEKRWMQKDALASTSIHENPDNEDDDEDEDDNEDDGDNKVRALTPPKKHRFIPPTVDDIKDYAWQAGIKIDAERFVDFYSSKGWMVGKSKMKDWKAAVRNWAARDRQEHPSFEERWASI